MSRTTNPTLMKLLFGLTLLTCLLLTAADALAVDLKGVAGKAVKKAVEQAQTQQDPQSAPDIKARLLSDHSAIAPGESFHVGVLLELPPQWHIYWRNPGEAGLATQIHWTLPEGFTAGPLRWPHPKTFDQPGDVTGYGYEGEALLWTTLTAPEDLQPGQKVTLRAKASYLACKDRCIPGNREVSLELPVAEKPQPDPDAAKTFKHWAEKTPRLAPDFTLADQAGKPHRLSDYRGKVVVLEWFNPDCPFVKRHHAEKSTMLDLANRFGNQGVVWLAVNSTHYMTPEKSAEWHDTWSLPYPVLIDRDGTAGKAYGAKTTPHMFILGTDGQILYEGAIDDAPRGGSAGTVYVDEALKDITAGKPVGQPQTRPYGCSVKYAK